MLAFLFPGQGSQVQGMGGKLFDEYPELVSQADEVLGYSIKELCLQDSLQQLNQTQYTQPALYVVNALSYCKKIQTTNQKPDFVIGHSLGEYSALFAAGVFDFVTGLRLVQERGRLMRQALNGGMAAVVGLQEDNIKQVLRENDLPNVAIANYNSYTQFVIAGSAADITRSEQAFKKMSAVFFIPLKVSGAFHSSVMLEAQQGFAEFLSQFKFAVPSIPVIANIDAKPYHPAVILSNLTQQLTHPVRWTAAIEYVMAQGEVIFEEIGSGNVLTGLMKRIKSGL